MYLLWFGYCQKNVKTTFRLLYSGFYIRIISKYEGRVNLLF